MIPKPQTLNCVGRRVLAHFSGDLPAENVPHPSAQSHLAPLHVNHNLNSLKGAINRGLDRGLLYRGYEGGY